jgi:hypothetical protein
LPPDGCIVVFPAQWSFTIACVDGRGALGSKQPLHGNANAETDSVAASREPMSVRQVMPVFDAEGWKKRRFYSSRS